MAPLPPQSPHSQNPSSSTAPAPIAAGVSVGIDVDKTTLDVARSDQLDATPAVFANDAAGIEALLRQLLALKPVVIVIESTGGLERALLQALLEANLPVALVHPGRVRCFARGLGILAKTDPIDARVLARFGQLASPRLAEKRAKSELELQALVVCRRQLAGTRTQQLNRRSTTSSKKARQALDAVLKTLERQLEALDQQIGQLIDSDDDFKHLDQLLRSVPGVGPTLSATLTAELRELGQPSRHQPCALVGVAPFNADSGARTGQRAIRGGRTAVRCVLYMATLAAMRCNPLIKTFAQRLKAAGKVSKVVIVACMRKLLTLLNAMVRDNLTWDQLDVVKNFASNH